MHAHLDRRRFLSALTGVAAAVSIGPVFAVAPTPPVARRSPVVDALWGEQIVDPYRWMENPGDPEWLPFMRGQAAHARARLSALPQRQRLLTRVAELSGDTVQVIEPRPAAGHLFFRRREAGESLYRLWVTLPGGAQRLLADPATFADRGAVATIDWWQPSPDARHVAFGVSVGGSEAATGHVVEVATGRLLEDRLAHVPYAAVAWLPDGGAFFYNRFAGRAPSDPAYYADRSVWLHRVGTAQSTDVRVMAQGMDPHVPMTALSSPEIQTGVGSDQVALLMRDGYVREFALYLADRADLLAGTPRWRQVCSARDGISDFALCSADLFLVDTSSAGGTSRGRLLRTNAATGVLADASPVFESDTSVVDELNAAGEGVYVTLNDGGEQSLLHVRANGEARPIGLPFTGWIQSVAVDPVAFSNPALVRISSWLEPAAVFTVDGVTATAKRTPLQPPPPIDLGRYESQRIIATARDGTRVPVTIVARKGNGGRLAPADSPGRPSPCLVHVYGAYQWPSQPVFDARAVALLEAGCMIATAHVRGGGEYGRAWHEGGRKATKPNTWRDLIDCCETLIDLGWTAKGRIAIMGGSAGGIAVGRAMTERPDLFGAVISKVGMSNPLRAEFEPNGRPNVPEFGSVATRDGFLALKAMDSYHAVRDGVRYPAMLLTTGLNDARVAPHNAAKMAARMQAARPGAEVLLRVEFDGGHVMNAAPKDQVDAEYADDFAFVLQHTRPARSRAGRSSG